MLAINWTCRVLLVGLLALLIKELVGRKRHSAECRYCGHGADPSADLRKQRCPECGRTHKRGSVERGRRRRWRFVFFYAILSAGTVPFCFTEQDWITNAPDWLLLRITPMTAPAESGIAYDVYNEFRHRLNSDLLDESGLKYYVQRYLNDFAVSGQIIKFRQEWPIGEEPRIQYDGLVGFQYTGIVTVIVKDSQDNVIVKDVLNAPSSKSMSGIISDPILWFPPALNDLSIASDNAQNGSDSAHLTIQVLLHVNGEPGESAVILLGKCEMTLPDVIHVNDSAMYLPIESKEFEEVRRQLQNSCQVWIQKGYSDGLHLAALDLADGWPEHVGALFHVDLVNEGKVVAQAHCGAFLSAFLAKGWGSSVKLELAGDVDRNTLVQMANAGTLSARITGDLHFGLHDLDASRIWNGEVTIDHVGFSPR